jgi:hypothetical protein
MYDDDIDNPTGMPEPNEWDEWDIPDLTLEFKGEKGSVQFRSLLDLSGAQVDRLRSVIGAAKNEGEAANAFYHEAARILITSWDIPGQPMLAIPKGDQRAFGQIPAVVRRQIEKHVQPYWDRLMKEQQDGDGDVFAVGGPSRPASV